MEQLQRYMKDMEFVRDEIWRTQANHNLTLLQIAREAAVAEITLGSVINGRQSHLRPYTAKRIMDAINKFNAKND